MRPCLTRRAVALVVLSGVLVSQSALGQQPARPSKPKPSTTRPAPVVEELAPPASAKPRSSAPALPDYTAPPAAAPPQAPGAASEALRSDAPRGQDVQVPDAFPPVDPAKGYTLGTGDVVRVSVFQQPDMGTETRVSESGTITVPLLGAVDVHNLSTKQAETRIVNQLRARGFVRDPYVNVTVLQFKSRQVSVLGYVNRPGRFALEEGIYRITDVLALAGGALPGASDVVQLVRVQEGKSLKLQFDLPALFKASALEQNLEVQPGDTLYVDRAPTFYIYGEVQRPGQYRLEKEMTLMQGLSVGGGLTLRASRKDIQINRRDKSGKLISFTASLSDPLQVDDVVFVKESLF